MKGISCRSSATPSSARNWLGLPANPPALSEPKLGDTLHTFREENQRGLPSDPRANPFPSVCARVCTHPCEEKCRAGSSGGQPISIRTLKRFITDQTDPSVYHPETLHRPGTETIKLPWLERARPGSRQLIYLSLRGYPSRSSRQGLNRVECFCKPSLLTGCRERCSGERLTRY